MQKGPTGKSASYFAWHKRSPIVGQLRYVLLYLKQNIYEPNTAQGSSILLTYNIF